MGTEGATVEVTERMHVKPLMSEQIVVPGERLCARCRHFDQDGTPFPTWGHCQMAKGASAAPVRFETKAYALDSAGYGARLCVAPDFGCNQFEGR